MKHKQWLATFLALIFVLVISCVTAHKVNAQGTIIGCYKSLDQGGTMRVDESTGSGWTCEANGCIVCRGGTCASGQGAKGYGTERCFGAVYGSGGGASYGSGTTTSGNSSGVVVVDRSAEIAAQQEAARQAAAREEAARQAFLQKELQKLQTAKEFDVQLQPGETGLSPEGLWTLGQYGSKRTIIPPGAPCNFNLFNYVEQRWWQYMCGPNTWAKFGHDGLPYYKIRQVFAVPATSQPAQPKSQPTTAARAVQSGVGGQPSSQYANDDQRTEVASSGGTSSFVSVVLVLLGILSLLAVFAALIRLQRPNRTHQQAGQPTPAPQGPARARPTQTIPDYPPGYVPGAPAEETEV